MNYAEWLDKMPSEFPELMPGFSCVFKNPVIGCSQADTRRNMLSLLKILYLLPRNGGPTHPVVLSLGEEETEGYCLICEALMAAAGFEEKYRPDGGEPENENNEADD